ncbi:hypothetical protein PS15p_200519 [Mucor circinelloides]
MNQNLTSLTKTRSAQKDKNAAQRMDKEIRILKEKIAKMRVLNDLECELLTLTRLRERFRALRAEAEKEIKTRYPDDDYKSSDNNTDYISDSDNSMDSHSDIK